MAFRDEDVINVSVKLYVLAFLILFLWIAWLLQMPHMKAITTHTFMWEGFLIHPLSCFAFIVCFLLSQTENQIVKLFLKNTIY